LPTFKVRPCLPEAPDPLLGIAYNLRWSWDHAAIDLFAGSIANCGKRRVAIRRAAGTIDQSLLESAAKGESFLTHLKESRKNSSATSLPRGRGTRGSMERTTTCRLPIFRPSLALPSACPSLRKVTTKIDRLIEEEFEQMKAQDRK